MLPYSFKTDRKGLKLLQILRCLLSVVGLYRVKFQTERLQVMWFFLTFKANFYKLVGRIRSFLSTVIKAY